MNKKIKPKLATPEDVGRYVQWIGRPHKGYITGCNADTGFTNVAWDWEYYINPPLDKHGKEQHPVWGYVLLSELIVLDDKENETPVEQT